MAMTTMEHNVHMFFLPHFTVQVEPFTPPPHSPLQSPPSIRHAHRYNHFFEDEEDDNEEEQNGEFSVRHTRRVLFPVVSESKQNE